MLSAERFDIWLYPSLVYCLLSVLLGAAALAAVWFADLSLLLQAGLSLALVLTLLEAAGRDGVRWAPQSVVRLAAVDGHYRLWCRDGSVHDVTLRPPVYVLPWLVILQLRSRQGRRFHVPIFSDAAAVDAFRRLRVFLRLANHSGEE